MTSSYRDPNVTAALAYQAEQEQRRKAQEQPSFIDVAGRTALGLGVAALAGAGIARGLRRNAMKPVSVEDLGATAARAEESVRRAARGTTTPPPSRPAPPAGVARQQAAEEFTRQARAERPAGINQIRIQDVVPTEEEFVAYRPDPKEMVSSQVAEARREAATLALLKASQSRQEPYQLTLGGEFSPTLQSIRSSEFGPNLTQVRERALGLVPAEAPSRPLAIAPDQLNIFSPRSYIEQTGSVEPTLKIAPESLVEKQQARTGFNVDQAINAIDAAEDQQTGRVKIQLQRNEDLDLGQVEVLEDIASQQRNFMMEQDEPINSVASQLPDGIPVDQTDLTPQLTSQQFADIAKDEMMARRQALSESGLRGERLERALGREPSRSVSEALEAIKPADIDEAPLQERTLINIGPGAQIEKAASGTSIRGTSRIGAVAAPQEPARQVSGPDYVMFEGRPVFTVNAPVEMAQDIPGVRRQSAPPAERIDEYALKSDLGGGIGIYGVEPAFAAGAVTKNIDLFQTPKGRTPLGLSPGAADPMISTTEAAGRQPSTVPSFTEKNNPFRSVSTEAIQKMAGAGTGSQSSAAQRELNRRMRNPEGIAISETMRRARVEGRDPQVFLDKLMRERGVSAAAGTSSPIR